jgi:hypothetical protein
MITMETLTYCNRKNAGGRVSKIYRNNSFVTNTPPVAPAGSHAEVSGIRARLLWSKSTDDHTSQNTLNYNVRIGTSPGGSDIVSPMAQVSGLQDGFRRIPKHGNVFHTNSEYFVDLAAGTYYWGVQAIDNSFIGSPFATEGTFTIPTSLPSTQASELIFSNITQTQFTVDWADVTVNSAGFESCVPVRQVP